ncbi:MAG TPA: YdcF family protein [Natronincola sp.]|nr:YdcF family protein [Natronincola sp.]
MFAGLPHILSLGFGILYILYLIIWPILGNAFENRLFEFIYAYLSFCFLFTLYIFALYTITNLLNLIKVPWKKYKYIVVLGSGLKDGMEVTPLLAGRVNKGIEAHRQNEGSVLILSGGIGRDEKIPEGEAMKNYALQQGVAKSNILVECQSTTTRENLLFSQAIIEELGEEGNILVVTTRYHVLRALLLAKNLGIKCDGRGSKTKLYFSINALVREWIANLLFL